MSPSKWGQKIKVRAHYCAVHLERLDATRCGDGCGQWLCVDCHSTHNCRAVGAGHRSAAPWTGRAFESSRPRTTAHRRDDVYRTSQENQ